MTLASQNSRLAWGVIPGEPASLAHAFMTFGGTHIRCCVPLILRTPPGPDDPSLPRCADCVAALADLDRPHPRAMPAPGEKPYSVHRHQELIDAVAAEFEAAGGRWPALQTRPINVRAARREMEAVLREHHDNVPALLREAIGYLEAAMAASYHWGEHDRDTQKGDDT